MPKNTENPFWSGQISGRDHYAVSADDRKDMVSRFNAEECHAALALPNLQTTVTAALQRRLKKLEKEHG